MWDAGGKGADAALDAVGGANAKNIIGALTRGGCYLLFDMLVNDPVQEW